MVLDVNRKGLAAAGDWGFIRSHGAATKLKPRMNTGLHFCRRLQMNVLIHIVRAAMCGRYDRRYATSLAGELSTR